MESILIVDDNRAAADGLARLLKALGYEATAYYSGEELLAALPTISASVAFIDIGMPGMDGYELIKRVRLTHPDLPAVAITGYGQEEDKAEAISAGFTLHLTKPVGVDELRGALSTLASEVS